MSGVGALALVINLLIIHPDNKRILCVKRSKNDKLFGGMWALPGGKNENGENILETSRRELLEETGLELLSISNKLAPKTLFKLDNYKVDLRIHKAKIKAGNIKPADKDIENAGWINSSKLINSLKEHKYPEEEISKLNKLFARENLT